MRRLTLQTRPFLSPRWNPDCYRWSCSAWWEWVSPWWAPVACSYCSGRSIERDDSMTIWRLVLREIAHRKLNFVLGLTSVVVAVACLVGALTLLHAHDRRTEKLLDERQEAVKKAGAELEDAIRRSTIKMGFNVLIVPKDQDLQELNVEGYASKYMPEDNAAKLAKAGIVTINHLLPSITQKLEWPEQKRTIIL